MHHSKEFLFSSSVIDLNRNQSSAFISQGPTVLHKYCTYSFNGSVAFDNKREKEVWQGQDRSMHESMLNLFKRLLAVFIPRER